MVRIKLKELLERNETTRYQLSKNTKLQRGYVDDLYFGRAKRITFEQIEILCKYFDITPSELFDYTK